MAGLDGWLEAVCVERLAAGGADGSDKNAPQCIDGRILLPLAAGEFQKMIDLHARSENRCAELAGEKLFQPFSKRRRVGRKAPLVDRHWKGAAALRGKPRQ